MTEADDTARVSDDRPEGSDGVPGKLLDLAAIERELLDVEVALTRLESGEYWNDEVTGEPLPVEFLAENPTARRLFGGPARPTE